MFPENFAMRKWSHGAPRKNESWKLEVGALGGDFVSLRIPRFSSALPWAWLLRLQNRGVVTLVTYRVAWFYSPAASINTSK